MVNGGCFHVIQVRLTLLPSILMTSGEHQPGM